MAKLTTSLPDSLKGRLEQYAQQHDLTVSQAVQKALKALLATPTPAHPEQHPQMGTTRDLADELARELQLPHRTTRKLIQRFLELVTDDLVETERFKMPGLGTLAIHQLPPRDTVHPTTGKPVHIPAHKTVRYRTSVALKQRLNPEPPANMATQ